MIKFFGWGGKGRRGPLWAPGPYHQSKKMTRSIAEMLQVIRRVLADGVVTEEEASALSSWTLAHPEVVDVWPGKILRHRLEKIFEDGKVDEEEREDLERLLRALAGGDWGVRVPVEGAGGIPLTDPPPVLIFPETEFVFVGEFAFGPLSVCQEATRSLGGRVSSEVGKGTQVLVVGTFGVENWEESPEAAAVRAALAMEKQGRGVAIVSEDYWAASLPVG